MTVGERIRKKRIEMGMTQDELAKRAGYKSRSSINKIEMSRDLPLKKILKVGEALDIPPAVLAGWTEDETPNIVEVPNRKSEFWERAEKNAEFMEYIKMLFYLPANRQQFIYTTIAAQDKDFRASEENLSNA